MSQVVYGYLDDALNALLASGGFGGAATLHLFSNNVVVGESDTLGTYTEATYAGYAPLACGPFAAAGGGSSGTSTSSGNPVVFAPGILATPQFCYGWFLTDAAGNLVGSDNFTGGPFEMGGAVPAATILPILTLT